MHVKTYVDTNLASALAQAHAELGPDALVLGSRDVRDERGRPRTEITVGVRRLEQSDRDERGRAVADSGSAMRRLVRAIADGGRRSRTERAVVAPEAKTLPAPPGTIDLAVASLVRSGLSRDLATRFARIAGRHVQDGRPGRLALAAERGVSGLVPFGPVPCDSGVLFVVGPPGAGKTTTVAKLAALAADDSRHPVVYAMADTERIGALAESRIYSQHVGAELRIIDTPGDLSRTLRETERHARVLVDTAGIGAADDRRMAALRELRAEARSAQLVLVLPAGLHRDEANRILLQFASVRPTCVAFSKVDDGRRIGDLVTALAGAELPLSFMTNGHRVPDDLIQATPGRLAALMLRAGRHVDSSVPKTFASNQESTR